MFRKLRKAQENLATVNHYFEHTIDNIEENKDAYRAGAIGFVVGAAVILAFRSRPVVVHNNITVCSHG